MAGSEFGRNQSRFVIEVGSEPGGVVAAELVAAGTVAVVKRGAVRRRSRGRRRGRRRGRSGGAVEVGGEVGQLGCQEADTIMVAADLSCHQ